MAAGVVRLFLCWACLILCFPCLFAAEYVPVFIWESSSDVKQVEVPALAKIHATEFKDIVSDKMHDRDSVVVFVEENLSVEDFSWQDAAGQGSYPLLQKLAAGSESTTYLPSVHAPLSVLDSSPGGGGGPRWQHVSLGPDGLRQEIDWGEAGRRLLVSLEDAEEDEDRPHLLRRHDAFMTELYDKLAKTFSQVTGIYTAHHPSWLDEGLSSGRGRSKREVNEGEFVNNTSLYNGDDRIYLYTSTVPLLVLDAKVIALGTPTKVSALNSSENILDQLLVEYDNAVVTFIFRTTSPGYWGLREVTVVDNEDVAAREHKLYGEVVEAPIGWSYHCSQAVAFHAGNKTDSSLTFTSIQVQPLLLEPLAGEVPKFGDTWDCTYFFTAPILSGILVAILFAWIMGFGICMIMDIKTMDRFDDPKGKTINVNAGD